MPRGTVISRLPAASAARIASTSRAGSIIERSATGGMRESASASKKGVRIAPGHTVSTCTPASSTSSESALARPTSANFVAA